MTHDVIVVGAGTAGIPCALAAAEAGASVLLVEKDERIGGTLHVSGGHMSAAGARRQRAAGIADAAAAHWADVQRISGGTVRADLARPAIEHAADTIDRLEDHGFDFAPQTPRIVHGHEPYGTARTFYGTDQGRSVLDVLSRLLAPRLEDGTIELWRSAEVDGLVVDDGRVVGLRVADGRESRGAAVVLATGGFGASPELFFELEGAPLVTAAHHTSTGDGLRLARGLGAGVAGRGAYLPTFGGLPDPDDPGRVVWQDRPLLVSTERTPWEVYVDRHGSRFVAEDEPSIDRKERALVEQVPDLTFWLVLDDLAVQHSPHVVAGWEPDDLRAAAGTRRGIHVADTPTELAAAAGIAPDGLERTLREYNDAVRDNRPDPLGRTARPAAIAEPPYYALRNHGITLITFAGVDVDATLRVRRPDGSVIDGLYAVGEVLGAAATTGNSFCSGMLVTPALTLGRLLGARLGTESARGPAPPDDHEDAPP